MDKPYVLIVDDDEDARTILSKMLGQLGVRTQSAEDGHVALEMIKLEAPQLILLDLMMPVMNGFEVLTYLRSDPRTRSIPVIVVSAVYQENMLMVPGVRKVIRKANMRASEVQSLVAGLLSVANPSEVPDDLISEN